MFLQKNFPEFHNFGVREEIFIRDIGFSNIFQKSTAVRDDIFVTRLDIVCFSCQ